MPTHITIFRHAEKSHFPPLDPELTPIGQIQAQMISQFESLTLPPPDALWCSEKKRTQQTLNQLAKRMSLKPLNLSLLNDQRSGEDQIALQLRIENLIDKIHAEGGSHLVICSHADIVHYLMELGPWAGPSQTSKGFDFWPSAGFIHANIDQNQRWNFLFRGEVRP